MEESAPERSKYGIRSIGLSFALLEHLAASSRPRGSSEIARELGINKWRVFRHLHALREEGYVTQDPATEKFEIGIKLYSLAASLPRRLGLLDSARPFLVDLQNATGQTSVLSALIEERLVVLESESGTNPIRVIVEPGTPIELHASAQGRVALAFGSGRMLERLARTQLTRRTGKTITDMEVLGRQIAATKACGWAISLGEHREGMNVVAAPVFATAGRLQATLASVYAGRLGPPKLADNIGQLLAGARGLSTRLGGEFPDFPAINEEMLSDVAG